MSDPRDDRRNDTPPLEAWALELEGESSDPETREELARVVSLLRGLPDPEPPSELVARVIEATASRPHPLRAGLRRLSAPPVALAMAAGIAGLLAIGVTTGSLPLPDAWRTAAPPETVVLHSAPTEIPSANVAVRRPTRLIQPQFVSLDGGRALLPRGGRTPFEAAFDHQLNQLMLDPTAYAESLESVNGRDRFISLLADRAVQRGDAPEVALQVRRSKHPLARQIVHRLLRATLVERVSPRQ